MKVIPLDDTEWAEQIVRMIDCGDFMDAVMALKNIPNHTYALAIMGRVVRHLIAMDKDPMMLIWALEKV
jgi:hypothetical protein